MKRILTETELIERTNQMMEILTKNEAIIRQFEGVLTMGIGFRESRNQNELGEACIYIEVKKKKSLDELEPSQVIPKEIEGIPTDVVEMIFSCTLSNLPEQEEDIPVVPDQSAYRPMLSGCQISDGETGKGTAGVFGHSKQSSSDNLGFITCKHVVPNEEFNNIYQPYNYAPYATAVGKVILRAYELIPGSADRTQLDIAVCQLNSDIKANNQLVTEPAYFTLLNTTIRPSLEQDVIKYGRSTRLTTGKVERLGSYIPNTKFHTSISVLGPDKDTFGNHDFAANGDSGSALLTTGGSVLGINSQMHSTHPQFRYTDACDIDYIKSKLGDNLLYPIPDNKVNMLIAQDWARLGYYKKLLSKSEAGREFVDLFIKYHAEGRELIMNNRECLVNWIRLSGPEFVMLRKKRFSSDSYELVKNAGNTTIGELLSTMFDVFSKNGSEGFAKELKKYHDTVLDVFKNSDTLETVVHKLCEAFETK